MSVNEHSLPKVYSLFDPGDLVGLDCLRCSLRFSITLVPGRITATTCQCGNSIRVHHDDVLGPKQPIWETCGGTVSRKDRCPHCSTWVCPFTPCNQHDCRTTKAKEK